MDTTTQADTGPYLAPAEAAAILGISTRTLKEHRYAGTGPAFVKVGHRTIRYRRADLDAWAESRLRTQSGTGV